MPKWLPPTTRRQKLAIVFCTLGSLLANLLNYIQPLITKRLLESLSHNGGILTLVLAGVALLTASTLLNAAAGYNLLKIGHSVVESLRNSLLEKLLYSRSETLADYEPGDIASRVTSETTMMGVGIPEGVARLFVGLVSSIFILTAMLYLSWQLTLVSIIAIIIAVFATRSVKPRLESSVSSTNTELGRLSTYITSLHRGLQVIQTNQAESFFLDRTVTYTSRAKAASLKGAAANTLFTLVGTTFSQLLMLIVITCSAYLVAKEQLPLPVAVSFMMYLFFLVSPISSVATAAQTLISAKAASERISDLETATYNPGRNTNSTDLATTPHLQDFEAFHLTLDNVRYAYPRDISPALDNISITLSSGNIVAIVGESGCGKSTLLKAIAGVLTPESGSITLGQMKHPGEDIWDWQSSVSYAPQETWLAPCSIRENIELGLPPSAEPRLEETQRIVASLNLTSTIADREEGINSYLGCNQDPFSGGQLQRLALARAIRRPSNVLLLDEVTANLDSVNTHAVMELLQTHKKNRIVIIATHRDDVWKHADVVLHMTRGRLSDNHQPNNYSRNTKLS